MREEVLVSVSDLPSLLAAGAVLLDVRWNLGDPEAGRESYLGGHLPGARFLDLETVLTGETDDPTQGRHPLPDAERLAAGLGALGVEADTTVVVYDQPGSFAAGRAWWVLRWAGIDVRVLDGGIITWLSADGALESGPATGWEPTSPQLQIGQLPTLTAEQVAGFAGQVIDVRAPERFRGEIEPIDAAAGHIPGAVNRPVSGFFTDTGQLPEPEVLAAQLDLDEGPLAVYCGSGVSAAQVVLALASLGIEAPLYPASWSGWSADPQRPVAVGS